MSLYAMHSNSLCLCLTVFFWGGGLRPLLSILCIKTLSHRAESVQADPPAQRGIPLLIPEKQAMTSLCPLCYAEQTQAQPTVIYGAVRWKGTAKGDGKCILICLFLVDRIGWGDSGHMSADICCRIENSGWSDRVRLKKQTDPIGPLV